ncbi:MAG TPA: DUF2877 domain-containing protein, partial [Planctomycetota bacterium]|nr:DUF2877 domain-containing protein [Planctomycetota bacterium]
PRGQRRLAEADQAAGAVDEALGVSAPQSLGEGLTPAGDDLLVGSLAVARRFRPDFVLENPAIGQALANAAREGTTLVACEFLLEALEGRFSETVIALLVAADVPGARVALDDLLALGATSGADTAAGMRLAVDAIESAPLVAKAHR